MKNLTMNVMLATAAWMVASSAASAAELRFEVPFAFQAAGKVMAPGTYKVQTADGETKVELVESKSGDGVYLSIRANDDPKKEWKGGNGAVLQFACVEGRCAIAQLWTNSGYPAHSFYNSKMHDGGSTRLALIRATPSK